MNTVSTKVLTAHVPLPLAEQVDLIAARLERSRGWIIKQALSAWVGQEEERRRLTLEGMADVDAGHVVDHLDVKAWADSLDTETPLPVPH
jgi:predicted transcriptional regulator